MTVAGNEPKWYVLNYVPVSLAASRKKAEDLVQLFNSNNDEQVEIFAPTYFVFSGSGKMSKMRQKPLVYHYVFVKGAPETVKKLCLSNYGFSFVIVKEIEGKKEHAAVSEKRLNDFRLIAARYSNSLPIYPLENVNLEDGDYIRIAEGDFTGLEGYFFPKARTSKGNVVIQITQNMGTSLFDIPTKYIEILKFSSHSNIKYHIIERFIPHLYEILRKHHSGESFNETDISALSQFIRRMGSARSGRPATDIKIAALLMASYRLMGDEIKAKEANERMEKRTKSVDSHITMALVYLLKGVIEKNRDIYLKGKSIMNSDAIKERHAPAYLHLMEEYDHYQSFFMPPA